MPPIGDLPGSGQGDAILLCVPRLARFLISGGHSILVALEDGALPATPAASSWGRPLGMILHQRGALVLHGSAVARDGRAMVLCGPSGAGKSTTAATLCQRGCSFVTDDICVVGTNTDHMPVAIPDGRQLKLWRQSIDALELAPRRGDAVRSAFEKYFVAPPTVVDEPPVLTAIYLLRESRPPHPDGIEPLALPDAMRVLEREAYRPRLRSQLTPPEQILSQAIGVLSHATVFSFTRPLGFDQLDMTVDALMQHWQSL